MAKLSSGVSSRGSSGVSSRGSSGVSSSGSSGVSSRGSSGGVAQAEARNTAHTEARNTAQTEAKNTVNTEAKNEANTEAKNTANTEAKNEAETAARSSPETKDLMNSAGKGNELPPTAKDARTSLKEKGASKTDIDDANSVLKNEKPSKKDSLNETDKSAFDKSKEWASKNYGKVILGLAAGIAAALAYSNYKASKDTKRGIIKIEEYETGFFANKKRLKITFTPDIRITINDAITITGSKTKPSIDVTDGSVYKVLSDSSIVYESKEKLTDMTAGGEISVKTSFGAQIGDLAGQTLDTAGKNLGTGINGFLNELFGVNLSEETWYFIIAGIILLVVFLIIMSS